MPKCHRCHDEEKTYLTRFDMMKRRIWHDLTRCPQDSLMWCKMDRRFYTKQNLNNIRRQILACLRDLASAPEEPENSTGGHTMAWDVLENGPMLLRSEPNLNISLIVCPSGVKFGINRVTVPLTKGHNNEHNCFVSQVGISHWIFKIVYWWKKEALL